MKTILCMLSLVLGVALPLKAEVKVELAPFAEWEKPILDKVKFGVTSRTLGEMLHAEGDKTGPPAFLVFTAEALENLEMRLLWADIEVEFSNGAIRKFENVSFQLIAKGIEADVMKLDMLSIDLFGNEEKPKPVEVTKLKIRSVMFK